MKIGILCAGDEELAPFLPLISNCKITEKAMLKFHAGQIDSVEVVALDVYKRQLPLFPMQSAGGTEEECNACPLCCWLCHRW